MTPEDKAHRAMAEGRSRCKHIRPLPSGVRACNCDIGKIDGCLARRDAIADAIRAAENDAIERAVSTLNTNLAEHRALAQAMLALRHTGD